jgi:hypothetical protein
MCSRVAVVRGDVSEERVAFISVKRTSELGTRLAVNNKYYFTTTEVSEERIAFITKLERNSEL